ncbi:uncharacterized protein VTP21DRAFT_10861 [Calcarisporiella thermophila]|uniref:uncharacterized protein n=1 Tax=Calcarisporiella thermophila TaxID=911321 RepID=UPI003742B4B4
MSERKVLNKYYPPDFDPSKIPRLRREKNQQHKVRLMAPFSMRCETCGEYIYKGKKFNARKETVEGEQYLSIKIFRFYIRCPRCSAEITFKTDPKNTDYVAELGASRNFEPWRDEEREMERAREEREVEEEENPMKALENRTLDSKREMDILDALDEIRLRNAQQERVNADSVLEKVVKSAEQEEEERRRAEEEEDERLAREAFRKVREENGEVAVGDEGREVLENPVAIALGASAPTATISKSSLSLEESRSTAVPNPPSSPGDANNKANGTIAGDKANGSGQKKRKLNASLLGIVVKKKK